MTIHYHFHHKCASRWALRYLQAFASLNQLTFFHSDMSGDMQQMDVDIAFWGNSSYEQARKHDLLGVHVVRNPVNLILSAYYSHLASHPLIDGWVNLEKQRSLLQQSTFEQGLVYTLTFLERADFGWKTPGPLYALRTWNYADLSFDTRKMEDVTSDPSALLRGFPNIDDLIMPNSADHTFARLSGGRQPGISDTSSHYRTGDPNDWRYHDVETLQSYIKIWFSDLLLRYYPEMLEPC